MAKAKDDTPVCCVRCFGKAKVRSFIKDHGELGGCHYCGAENVSTIDPILLADVIRPLVKEYQQVQPGVHFIPALQDAIDVGQPIEELIDEDHPKLFSKRLDSSARESLLEALFDGLNRDYDFEDPRYRVRSSELWTRPGNELWGEDEEFFFDEPPSWWAEFVNDIRNLRRFKRDGRIDPAQHLTPDLLQTLAQDLPVGFTLYRAVAGGERDEFGALRPHNKARMAGPLPEHSRRGGRVNPPGIPMLYAADSIATVIAEVRPFKGAPVSVATLKVKRALRVVDFSRQRRTLGALDETDTLGKGLNLPEVLDPIAREMARPVDPDSSETEYVPTQYVAELVKAAGYNGLAFESALGPGTNIVLFDRSDAEVVKVDLYAVRDVTYEFHTHPDTAF